MNLIFLGYPGSGKGTVAKLLTRFKQISTGDLLRAEIASGSELGQEIAKIINGGNLVSDEMALKLIKANYSKNESYIFDGFPRTVKQAEMLIDLIGTDYKVVFFDVPKEVLVDRIVNRRSCPSCGEIFNLKSKPPKKEDTCDSCDHVGLTHRDDDQEETLKKRLDIFNKDGQRTLNFFKGRDLYLNQVITIDASQSSSEVINEFNQKVLSNGND